MTAKFTERPYSPATTPVSSPRPGVKKRPFSTGLSIADKLDEMNVSEVGSKQSPRASPRSPRELSQQLSRSQENVTPPPENPRDSDSVVSVRKESRGRKISSQTGRLSPPKIKYVAVSSFHGEEKGEVVLEEGEEVEVLQKEASGWWYVKTEVSEGWAPCAFLVPVQSSRSSSPVPASQEQSSERQEENSSEGQKEEGTVKVKELTCYDSGWLIIAFLNVALLRNFELFKTSIVLTWRSLRYNVTIENNENTLLTSFLRK